MMFGGELAGIKQPQHLVEVATANGCGCPSWSSVDQRFIEDPLSEKILLAEFQKGDEVEVDVSADGTKLEFRVSVPAVR